MKCYRCDGKGGYEQATYYSPYDEPDVSWDLCPVCDGKGEVEDEEI
jgi:hypothetical protein